MNRWILLTICFVPLVLSILLVIPEVAWNETSIRSENLQILPNSVYNYSGCSNSGQTLTTSIFNAKIKIEGGCSFETEVDFFSKGGLCDPDGKYRDTKFSKCCGSFTRLAVMVFFAIFCMVLCTVAAFYYAFRKKTKKILYGISIFLTVGYLPFLIGVETREEIPGTTTFCTDYDDAGVSQVFFIFTGLTALILPIYTYFYYDKVSSKSTSTTYNINSLLF